MKIKIDWDRFIKEMTNTKFDCFHINIVCPHGFLAIKKEINRQILELEKNK